MSRMMNVREVADYLNIKERKVYDLVRLGRIPCSRVTGKWLFPQDRIDRWVEEGIAQQGGASAPPAPPVVAGSHDPLLEWSLRESACGLALMPGGSLDGLERLAGGQAQVCGVHVLDEAGGEYNVSAVRRALAGSGAAPSAVLLEWAWRTQGLVLAPGNPLGIAALVDLQERKARVIQREEGAGAHLLLAHLLARAEIAPEAVNLLPRVARSETEVGLAIMENHADAGLAVEAVARQLRLDFLPLHRERYDLVLQRRDYFEPPFQNLLAFTRESAFQQRATELGGYDVSGLGRVHFNGP